MPSFFSALFSFATVGACYIGALVGAGFATGKEMELFFARFFPISAYSTLFAGFLFAFFAYATIVICQKKRIHTLEAFFSFCLGKTGGFLMYHFLQLFLFFSITVMFAAGDSLTQVFFSARPGIGSLLLCFFLWGVLYRPQGGMVYSNLLLVPLLLLIMLMLWLQIIFSFPAANYFYPAEPFTLPQIGIAFFWAALYVSYNFLGACAILVSFSDSPQKSPVWGGFFAGILIGILLFTGTLALGLFPVRSQTAPMPFLAMAQNTAVGFWIYAFSLAAAIVTTAIASSFAMLQQASFRQKGDVLFLALFVAYYGDFSGLVSFLYPFTGMGGLCLLVSVTYHFFTCRRK